eukprot:scaffold3300_cov239-Pinguiococcus_pyrenoidosus.AAC.5
MRLRRANHADFRVFPRVWNDLLDGPPEALGALVLELLVLRALGVQALPDRPRLIPGRVCVDDVLASRGQSRIKLGRHAHDNHIARDIDAVLVPSIHDRPLRRSVVGHELLIDPNVHVHEALALLDVPSPELVRLLVESLVSAWKGRASGTSLSKDGGRAGSTGHTEPLGTSLDVVQTSALLTTAFLARIV